MEILACLKCGKLPNLQAYRISCCDSFLLTVHDRTKEFGDCRKPETLLKIEEYLINEWNKTNQGAT